MEKYPIAVLDVSMLPTPKKQMKVLLKSLYAKATTPEIQNYLAVGFTLLSQFQEGVGPTPIDGTVLAQLDQYLAWAKVTEADADSLTAEWRRFLAGEPI